jgi:hypothetical protein
MDADGNGELTLNEFMDALTQMPGHVLLEHLRQRLLSRFASVNEAFREVSSGVSGLAARLNRAEFEVTLMRMGIHESEASELFRVIDDDDSGDISLQELQDALRGAAPITSLGGFWHRVAMEWPELASCALQPSRESNQRDRLLLSELMPPDLLKLHGGGPLPGDSHNYRMSRTPAAEGEGDAGAEERASTLVVLTAETFDALAMQLDISHDNAMKLFKCIVSATGQQPRTPGKSMEIYVEDFMDQLKLWSEESLLEAGVEMGNGDGLNGIRKAMAPGRAAIDALKRELSPTPPVVAQEVAKTAAAPPVGLKDRRRTTMGLRVPYVPRSSLRFGAPSPVPF